LEPVVTSFSGSRGPRRRGIVLDKKNEVGRDSRTPKPIGKEASGKRLVLGFDGGCSACGELARRIGETTSKLEVRSLHDPRVEEWRRKALGEDAPLVPTLFEVGESERGAGVDRLAAGGCPGPLSRSL
jgi:hypothetical protein